MVFLVTEKAGFEPDAIFATPHVCWPVALRVASRVAYALFVHLSIGANLILTNPISIHSLASNVIVFQINRA